MCGLFIGSCIKFQQLNFFFAFATIPDNAACRFVYSRVLLRDAASICSAVDTYFDMMHQSAATSDADIVILPSAFMPGVLSLLPLRGLPCIIMHRHASPCSVTLPGLCTMLCARTLPTANSRSSRARSVLSRWLPAPLDQNGLSTEHSPSIPADLNPDLPGTN